MMILPIELLNIIYFRLCLLLLPTTFIGSIVDSYTEFLSVLFKLKLIYDCIILKLQTDMQVLAASV